MTVTKTSVKYLERLTKSIVDRVASEEYWHNGCTVAESKQAIENAKKAANRTIEQYKKGLITEYEAVDCIIRIVYTR